MVVDDERELLDLFAALLESLDCETFCFQYSPLAAQCAESEHFDGIFLDVRMPDMDGCELARQIRQTRMNSRTPLVMVTGYPDAEVMRAGFDAGVNFFLPKPFQRHQLARLVSLIGGSIELDRRRSRRLPLKTSVECRVADRLVPAASVNIGETGMLLEMSEAVTADPGAELQLQFHLPGWSRPVVVRARAVRTDAKARLAVQFLDLTERDLERLQKYLGYSEEKPATARS